MKKIMEFFDTIGRVALGFVSGLLVGWITATLLWVCIVTFLPLSIVHFLCTGLLVLGGLALVRYGIRGFCRCLTAIYRWIVD